ncbi:MAG: hypothetical protein ACK2UW_17460 [Anaerolineales bacterium]|jgi:hypothetical protein
MTTPQNEPATPRRDPRSPIYGMETPGRETESVSFADLVRLVAEGILDAQTSLDRAAAEMLVELSKTQVEVVTRVTETIHPDGTSTYRSQTAQRSLLEIGVLPTFYQFAEATIEVSMDLVLTEQADGEPGGDTPAEKEDNGGGLSPYTRRPQIRATTRDVRLDRQLNREVRTHSRLSARLVPVPRPLRLEPQYLIERSNEPAPEQPGGADE